MKLLWPARVPDVLRWNEVQVWAWSFGTSEQDVRVHSELLSDEERERLQRFYFLRHRIQFATSHSHLRRILGQLLNRDAKSLRFSVGNFGKPTLNIEEHGDGQTSFNLTHSSTAGVLAVASGIEIGVDVETVRPIEPEVAEAHFSERELSDLNTLNGDQWLGGFYRIWTRKEALLKAEGVGLNLPLADFDVSVLPGCEAELLGWRPSVNFTYMWQLQHLAPATSVIGALAMSGTPAHIMLSSFEI